MTMRAWVVAAALAGLVRNGSACNGNATSCGDCVSVGANQCIWAEGIKQGVGPSGTTNYCTTKTAACNGRCNATLPANHTSNEWNSCQAACESQPCSFAGTCKMQTCLVSAKTLWIIVGSVIAAVVIAIGISCWCWCRKRNKRILNKKMFGETRSMAKTRKKRERRQEARRNERSDRTNAIREKYGLADNDHDDELLESGRDDELSGW